MKTVGALAAAVFVASICGALTAQRSGSSSANVTAPAAASSRRAMVGFAINLHHTEQLPKYRQSIEQIADMGANAFELLTPAFQRDGAGETITIETGAGRGPEREQIIALLRHARERRLITALMPTVLLSHPRGNEWRGKISPENWDRWWDSYNSMFDYFLDIAVEAEVDILSVGSELLTTEEQTQRWQDLIRRARSRFSGKLMYSTNWDHYHVPKFWQDLDVIGISGYWDMTTLAAGGEPTDEELAARWRDIQGGIFAYASAQQMTVLITEVGYPSLPWALKSPWNYVNSKRIAADHEAQLRGYTALTRAWDEPVRSSGQLAGVMFYAWDPYHQGQPSDTGYGVRGKPAESVLRDWLASLKKDEKR